MELDVVDIEWEGPFQVTYDRESDRYGTDAIPSVILDTYGFYQIYGRHPVYGPDVLLYIGETKKNENATRSFRARLSEHLAGRFYDHANLSVYFGRSRELDASDVKKVESLLIWTHMPALNRRHLDGVVEGSEGILVRNWGFLGSLESACVGSWDT